MTEKSMIDLCAGRGIDAIEAIALKLRNPAGVDLRIGSAVISRITVVSHDFKDGLPVVSGDNADGQPIIFQFRPDLTPFSESAVNDDGVLICGSGDAKASEQQGLA